MTGTTNLDRRAVELELRAVPRRADRRTATACSGSAFEADDAVQETLVRAWRGFDRFEGRAVGAFVAVPHREQRLLRHAEGPQASCAADRHDGGREARDGPVDPPTARSRRGSGRFPTVASCTADGDPADEVVARESVRLAFVAALQHLPPRQRAVLILREVLRWKADRGRRAARHDRRVGQQRAPARSFDPRRTATSPHDSLTEPSTASSRSCSPVTSTRSSASTSTRW